MDGWEKMKIVTGAFAAIVLPIVLLIVGNDFSSATKERELEGKFVELSAQILREPSNADTKNLKLWAAAIINKYSGVPMSEALQNNLTDQTTFPPLPNQDSATRWGVVFGGDDTLDKAQHEIDVTGPKMGIDSASIYFRRKSYRSVAVFLTKAEAETVLAKAKDKRDDSYMVDMARWCPLFVQKTGYLECTDP